MDWFGDKGRCPAISSFIRTVAEKICAVGTGIAPVQLARADFYRRSGISPCPEDVIMYITNLSPAVNNYSVKSIDRRA